MTFAFLFMFCLLSRRVVMRFLFDYLFKNTLFPPLLEENAGSSFELGWSQDPGGNDRQSRKKCFDYAFAIHGRIGNAASVWKWFQLLRSVHSRSESARRTSHLILKPISVYETIHTNISFFRGAKKIEYSLNVPLNIFTDILKFQWSNVFFFYQFVQTKFTEWKLAAHFRRA